MMDGQNDFEKATKWRKTSAMPDSPFIYTLNGEPKSEVAYLSAQVEWQGKQIIDAEKACDELMDIQDNGIVKRHKLLDQIDILKPALEKYADSQKLAELFHEHYEYFAKTNDWKTNEKCRVDFKDLPKENRITMLKTAAIISEIAKEALDKVGSVLIPDKSKVDPDINTCPGCGGPADNGFDRCDPPNPYYCTKCDGNK